MGWPVSSGIYRNNQSLINQWVTTGDWHCRISPAKLSWKFASAAIRKGQQDE
jgi:hypothetical protein